MQCKGEFIFKEIKRVDAGSFKNDLGEEIKYSASFRVKADEKTENGIQERVFRIPENDTTLASAFAKLNAYTKVEITFDLQLYTSSVRLVPKSYKLI